jgi:hypothetical protein
MSKIWGPSPPKKKSAYGLTTIAEFAAAAAPENLGAAASRIYGGAPARQPELTSASRKTVGGAAEGSKSSSSYTATSSTGIKHKHYRKNKS